jgi:uncharacterized OsmC-like protein
MTMERTETSGSVPDPRCDNGVDLDALLAARDALSESSGGTRFQWQARNEWVHGAHSRTTIQGYVVGGTERHHASELAFDADHPAVLGADDRAAAPAEFLLHALASCLTALIATEAQQRRIQLRGLTSTLSADMDVAGMLGVDRDSRSGFGQICVDIAIDANGTPYELRNLVASAVRRSAVFDALTRGVDITTHVDPASGR